MKRALQQRGISMKEASLLAKKGETFVRDMLERDREPGLDSFAAVAKVVGQTVSELIGEIQSSRTQPIRVVGVAGAGPDGAIAFGGAEENLGEAPVPPGATADTVAVEVRGNSMRGVAEDGWLVYFDERRDPPTEDLLGEICIVGLLDGRVLIKRLLRGRKRKHFDLESAAAPTLQDVKIEWAARVTAIVPRRRR